MDFFDETAFANLTDNNFQLVLISTTAQVIITKNDIITDFSAVPPSGAFVTGTVTVTVNSSNPTDALAQYTEVYTDSSILGPLIIVFKNKNSFPSASNWLIQSATWDIRYSSSISSLSLTNRRLFNALMKH